MGFDWSFGLIARTLVCPAPVPLPQEIKPDAIAVEAPSQVLRGLRRAGRCLGLDRRFVPAQDFPPLTARDGEELGRNSGLLRRGRGALEGTLALRPVEQGSPLEVSRFTQQAVLITHVFGERSEVVFGLDLPLTQAAGLEGKRVRVHADWTAPEPFARGAGRRAKIEAVLGSGAAAVGERIEVEGRVVPSYGAAVMINGYRDPPGVFLALDHPLRVGRTLVDKLYLEGGDSLSLYQHVSLQGGLEAKVFGDNAQPTLCVRCGVLKGLHQRESASPLRLDTELLEEICGPLSYPVEGSGVVQGELALRQLDGEERPYLVTFQLGAEAGFFLDWTVEACRHLVGKNLRVAGLLRNNLDPEDTLSQAKLVATLPDRPSFAAGDWAQLEGVVQTWPRQAADGRLLDRLVLGLADHVLVEGRRTQVLELPADTAWTPGAKLRLVGRLEVPKDARGQALGAVVAEVAEVSIAPELDYFALDPEAFVDDFMTRAGPRYRTVVPADQSAAADVTLPRAHRATGDDR